MEARDTHLEVSVLRGSEACDDLRAVVQVLQDGAGKTESQACLDDQNRQARTELVIGQGPSQQFYKVLFEYIPKQRTVSYTIRRLSGTGIIESQRVILDLSGRS
jgi:hypothetical protein